MEPQLQPLPRYHLRGELLPGQFPEERAILFEDFRGHEIGVLVWERDVTPDGDEGLIVVKLLEDDGDLKLVGLPGLVFGAQRSATVRAHQLQPIPDSA